MSNNYYNILGVSPGVSLEELEKAYRNKARECHPDRAAINNLTVEEATKKFQALGEAFNKLKEELENRESTHNNNAFPKSHPSDPRFWTEPISSEERKKTSEEAIWKIGAEFTSSGVTADDLEVWVLGFYGDWKTMMKSCYTRGEFNINYNRILDAIKRAAARKKNLQTNGKEEKNNDENWEKKRSKKGFATKEEADEYARKKQAEDEALDKRKNSQFSDDSKKKNNSFIQPESENNSSTNNSQASEPVNNLNPNSDSKRSTKENDNKNPQQTKKNDHLNIDYLNPDLLEKHQEEKEEQKKLLESLKEQLTELKSQQLNRSNEQQSTIQQPNSNFPWMIVIPMGTIILTLGGVILFLLGKKKG